MQAEKTTLTTHVLGPPLGWDADGERCAPLPVVRTPEGVISYWRPSAAEIAAISAGALVSLHLWGASHPPVAIEVETVQTSHIIQPETAS